MSRKARHRKPWHLLNYPFIWYVRQWQNRKALRLADERLRKAKRIEDWEAFKYDVKGWWNRA
jgi:hypothetical protein